MLPADARRRSLDLIDEVQHAKMQEPIQLERELRHYSRGSRNWAPPMMACRSGRMKNQLRLMRKVIMDNTSEQKEQSIKAVIE